MFNFISQLVCGMLLLAGTFFIFIEWKAKYDRSFLYFGTSLLLLAIFAGADIWATPHFRDIGDHQMVLVIQQFDHILVLAFIPSSIAYLMILTNTLNTNVIKIFVFVCMILSISVMSSHMLYLTPNGEIATTTLYEFLFGPFLIISIGYILFLIIRQLAGGAKEETKILIWHLVGFSILSFFGIIEILWTADVAKLFPQINSLSIFGIMVYGVMAVWVFSERFISILQDRQLTFKKLQNTIHQLEEANTLKQLGESTAIINHQIKNQMNQLTYWISSLEKREHFTQRGAFALNHLKHISRKIINFSQDILDMSRSSIMEQTALIDICHFYRQVVVSNFPSKRHCFKFDFPTQTVFTYMDWGKMEQAYVNICQNALDAVKSGTPVINIRLILGPDVILLCVEDNGVGCTKKQEKMIFNSFYTTKPGKTGTGLGLTLAKNIIESHGGKISARSKNTLPNHNNGLKVFISLPRYHNEELDKTEKSGFAIIRENISWFPELIQILNHVHADPFIFSNFYDFISSEQSKTVSKILISTESYYGLKKNDKNNHNYYLLSHSDCQTYILPPEENAEPQAFTEEYVVSRLGC